MQIVRKNQNLKAPPGVNRLWAEISSSPASSRRLAPPPPPCVTGDTTIAVAGPLLQTQWGQGWPYNFLCPYDINSYAGDNYDFTGCVATAMAQVMYYWHYPANYYWSAMPLNYNSAYNAAGNQSVSQLMADIGFGVGINYTSTESSAYANNVPFTFKSYFGYSSATIDNYYNSSYTSYNTVISNLDHGWPVLLSGDNGSDGHEWVCDGYMESQYTDCEAGISEVFLMFDMNWGWDGQSNGYFGFNYWNVLVNGTSFYWQYNLQMTHEIHP